MCIIIHMMCERNLYNIIYVHSLRDFVLFCSINFYEETFDIRVKTAYRQHRLKIRYSFCVRLFFADFTRRMARVRKSFVDRSHVCAYRRINILVMRIPTFSIVCSYQLRESFGIFSRRDVSVRKSLHSFSSTIQYNAFAFTLLIFRLSWVLPLGNFPTHAFSFLPSL